MITTFRHKNIAILGAGIEGQSAAKYVKREEGNAVIFDEKERPFPTLQDFDLIFRSPGVPVTHPRLLEAVLHNQKITSTVNYFMNHAPTSNIIGVTGTKGKGTTSTLIHLMLKAAGKKSFLGGNIGTPPLDFLDEVTHDSWVVLELSSFQLMDIQKDPRIAVVLMTTQEHLDWHPSVDEYIAAKANITVLQSPNDILIANMDYHGSRKIAKQSPATVIHVSTKSTLVESGCFLRGDEIIYKGFGKEEVVTSRDFVQLPGPHNLENVCAAICAAKVAGVSNSAIVQTLQSFTGLEHRLEKVREVGGVTFYNDSFSTVPETTIAAIRAFGAPKILILGGSPKHSDFYQLADVIRNDKSVKGIVGIGMTEWLKIKKELGKLEIPVEDGFKTMKEVVDAARGMAQAGDIVLLSPACASFDMFNNYKDRGVQFKDAVNAL